MCSRCGIDCTHSLCDDCIEVTGGTAPLKPQVVSYRRRMNRTVTSRYGAGFHLTPGQLDEIRRLTEDRLSAADIALIVGCTSRSVVRARSRLRAQGVLS